MQDMLNGPARLFVLVALMALTAISLAACSQATPTVEPTAMPAKPTEAQAQPTNTVAPTATVPPATATTAATAAQAPQPAMTPLPFTATITILAIHPDQNVALPRVDDPKSTFALFTTGLNVVPAGVAQYIQASAIGLAKDAKVDFTSAAWTVKTKPEGSNATIAAVKADEKTGIPEGAAVFTPDKTGEYAVELVVKDSAGNTSVAGEQKFVAAQYVGVDTCKGCHAQVYDNWSKTGHAQFFKEMVDTNAEGEYAQLGFNVCAKCHTAGYYPITKESTHGWWDTFINVLKLDPKKDFADKVAQAKPGTYDSLDPKLKTVSNITCESCHGPGGIHAASPNKENMAFNAGPSGSCNQCHNDGHFHVKGEQLENARHAQAGNLTAANGRAECARCHSGGGFIDFLAGKPADQQRNQVSELGCPACHDPHKNANFAQLRIVGQPKDIPVEVNDAGLSAVCMECHNGRVDSASVTSDKPQFPHYSAATEALMGTGGYDFGLLIPNSPHGNAVGAEPVTTKDAAGNEVKLFGGNAPGACVYCHMYETPGGSTNAVEVNGKSVEVTDETNPGHNLVGAHSFNMVARRPNGETVENVAACQVCHTDIKEFNFPAISDYDGNGKIEGVQDEVKGLLAQVKKAIEDKGAKASDNYPYFVLPDNPSTELKGAVFNYRFVMGVIPSGEGRAAAVHNFQRSVALLQASYYELTGQDIPNATILYQK
jgi:hypothetical protein